MTSRTLNIGGIFGDTAEQTLARMKGGWLVDLSTFPETRGQVETWARLADDRAAARSKVKLAEGRQWQSIADQLKAILKYGSNAAAARAHYSPAAGEPTIRASSAR